MKLKLTLLPLIYSLYICMSSQLLYTKSAVDDQNIFIVADEAPAIEQQDVVTQKIKNTPKESPVKIIPKVIAKPVQLKTTLFVNGRCNTILLVITDDKNKIFKITIKAGMHYECKHKLQSLKKVVCHEIATPNTTLSQTDLHTFSVFVFNTDQKLEKYKFININQKHAALKHASHSKNETLFHEISEQNVYYP